MKGYIGVTSREWFLYLAEKSVLDEVNFWRKNTDQFKVLVEGEPFFFLVKNKKGVKGERAVLGMAVFQRFEILKVEEAWRKYKDGNGDEKKEHFISRMNSMFGTNTTNDEIGCIILSNFQSFDHPVYLSEIGIEFQNSVVSGKGISEIEIDTIIEHGCNVSRVVYQLSELEQLVLREDEAGFPEGKSMLKQHLVRERNPEVIKLAKKRYLSQHGKLVCEVCGFDFQERYGEIGEGYIEGHHTKPISEMEENERTKVEDIALVCANCHRMLHRRRPWLLIDELKQLLE